MPRTALQAGVCFWILPGGGRTELSPETKLPLCFRRVTLMVSRYHQALISPGSGARVLVDARGSLLTSRSPARGPAC